MVGNFKERIKKYLEKPKQIPHFLFYSRNPGTGKTTLARAICNELKCDLLEINSSDDRKIDVIRDKVKTFAVTESSKTELKRCVFLDEIDGMLKPSQNALRNVMETYSKNVFFILTCNNVNKVIDPLRDRCQQIHFAQPDKKEFINYLLMICKNEGLTYNAQGLTILMEMNYPSIRNCVGTLQDLYTRDLSVVQENIHEYNEDYKIMWNLILEKDWKKVKEALLSTSIDARDLNMYFWEKSIKENNIKLIQLTCRNEKDIAWGADAKVIMVTSLIEMVK